MTTSTARHALPIAVALALACGAPPHDDHAHHDEAPAAQAPHDGEETLSVPLAGIRGIHWAPAPEPRAEGAWYPGEAIGDEGARIALSSPVAGIVASAPAAPSRPLARGAELLVLESPERADLAARAKVAAADAERARASLAREERLFAAGATSAAELEQARREAEVAAAEDAAARAGLAARGLDGSDASPRVVVRAPAAGSVVRWNVRRGEGVAAGAPLGEYQAEAARLVRVDLTPPGPGWAIGDATEVRASDGRRWSARVAGVPSALSDDTRRLAFRLALTDGAPPLPGQPVEVRVPYAAAVILPQAAVQQIEGTWGVFVRDGDRARFTPIRRGVELGSDVVVERGVTPGEEVVTDGAYLLKSLWLKGRAGGDDHDH